MLKALEVIAYSFCAAAFVLLFSIVVWVILAPTAERDYNDDNNQ